MRATAMSSWPFGRRRYVKMANCVCGPKEAWNTLRPTPKLLRLPLLSTALPPL